MRVDELKELLKDVSGSSLVHIENGLGYPFYDYGNKGLFSVGIHKTDYNLPVVVLTIQKEI